MKNVNFFKAYSRLGMKNIPWGGKEMNVGVEDAPDYILTPEFLSSFKDYSLQSFVFPKPEAVDMAVYFKTIADYSKKFADMITKMQHKDNRTAVVIGGDHSIGYASIMAQLELFGDNMGVIHFDSHEDACNVSGSPTKNFHGMYIRALTDEAFDDPYIKSIPKHLSTQNLLMIGNIDCSEDPEGKYLKDKKIKYFEKADIQKDEGEFITVLGNFISQFDHIHISFDIDIFDKSIVTATGTPSLNGFFWSDLITIYNMVRFAKSISLDLVEVNPQLLGAEGTISIGQRVLMEFLK